MNNKIKYGVVGAGHLGSFHVQQLLKIDNVFDEQYQVVNKYGTSNRAFYIGIDGAF